jgi:hypothetical protein
MDPLEPELGSQASQAKPVTNEPTAQEIEKWNRNELLQWILQKKPGLFEDENLEKFKNACISAESFLEHAIPPKLRERVAELLRETVAELLREAVAELLRETVDSKSKYHL